MATFNGERFIKKQLISILKQLDENDQLIISDDSSTDNSLQIIKSLHDQRILLLEDNKFKNPVFNIENALKHATGEYIFLTDQDDIWVDNKVELCLNYLKTYDLILSDCVIIDENDNKIEDSFFRLRNSRKGFIKNLVINSYIGCCMAFNKKILYKALPFPQNITMHDMWIGLIAELIGKTHLVNQKLVLYRRHKYNISTTSTKSKYSLLMKCKYRIIIFGNLLKRVYFSPGYK
jgi:glycosyltransferase involved in cell wall biosynthesis